MTVKQKAIKMLSDLGREYEEHWIRRHTDHQYVKEVEVFFTDEEIEERGEGECTSWVCHGWQDVWNRLNDIVD